MAIFKPFMKCNHLGKRHLHQSARSWALGLQTFSQSWNGWFLEIQFPKMNSQSTSSFPNMELSVMGVPPVSHPFIGWLFRNHSARVPPWLWNPRFPHPPSIDPTAPTRSCHAERTSRADARCSAGSGGAPVSSRDAGHSWEMMGVLWGLSGNLVGFKRMFDYFFTDFPASHVWSLERLDKNAPNDWAPNMDRSNTKPGIW